MKSQRQDCASYHRVTSAIKTLPEETESELCLHCYLKRCPQIKCWVFVTRESYFLISAFSAFVVFIPLHKREGKETAFRWAATPMKHVTSQIWKEMKEKQ